MTSSRRRFLLASGTIAATGLAGCLGGSGDLPDDVPDTPTTNAPVPDSPGDYDYETMGTGDGPTVTYFGNWKCPHCATFSTSALNDIVTDYVEPGDVNLRYRAWTGFMGNDDVRAGKGGLAVWNVAPERYWTYHEYVMANQPSSSQEWATTDWLTTAAEKVGVEDVDAVRSGIESDEYNSVLQRTADDAQNAGYRGTPTLVVDGQSVSPMTESGGLPDSTRSALDQLASR